MIRTNAITACAWGTATSVTARMKRKKTMARYIDADAFEVFGYTSQDGTFDDGVQFVLEKLDEQPTADVVEVVHGKNISKGGFLCSVCKFGDFNGFHGYEPNFCPNCGADMRKDGE